MTKITVSTVIKAPITQVREKQNNPEDIMQRNHANDDRHCPSCINDLRVDGKFSHTMAVKDGSFSFEFSGVYTQVVPNQIITYRLDDGREVATTFTAKNDEETSISTVFDAEDQNPLEMQQRGRQAILDNFKKHVES